MAKFERILIVDDDEQVRKALSGMPTAGWSIYTAANGAAIDAARGVSPDLVVLDHHPNGKPCLDVIRAMREAIPAITIIVMSNFLTVWVTEAVMRAGAVGVVEKPVDIAEILAKAGQCALPSARSERIPSLAMKEWEYMQRVLEACGGNVSEAARRLRVRRVTLQRKLKKLPPHE